MKQFKKILLFTMMALALLIGIQSVSHATPLEIFLYDGVNPAVFVLDNGVGDTNLTNGVVSWSGSIGNWIVNVTTAITYPVLGTAASPQLDLNSINATSISGGNLYVAASALDYTLAPTTANFLLGGTTDATAIQTLRAGVPAGCVSIPTRYIHSPSEMVDYGDVQGAVKLLKEALTKPISIE